MSCVSKLSIVRRYQKQIYQFYWGCWQRFLRMYNINQMCFMLGDYECARTVARTCYHVLDRRKVLTVMWWFYSLIILLGHGSRSNQVHIWQKYTNLLISHLLYILHKTNFSVHNIGSIIYWDGDWFGALHFDLVSVIQGQWNIVL